MQSFRVWIRPLGDVCRVRVEGVENSRWLVDRLRGAAEIHGGNSPRQLTGPGECIIQVLCTPRFTASQLREALGAMPEVSVMIAPA